jgi:hypothetical protein
VMHFPHIGSIVTIDRVAYNNHHSCSNIEYFYTLNVPSI